MNANAELSHPPAATLPPRALTSSSIVLAPLQPLIPPRGCRPLPPTHPPPPPTYLLTSSSSSSSNALGLGVPTPFGLHFSPQSVLANTHCHNPHTSPHLLLLVIVIKRLGLGRPQQGGRYEGRDILAARLLCPRCCCRCSKIRIQSQSKRQVHHRRCGTVTGRPSSSAPTGRGWVNPPPPSPLAELGCAATD